MDVKIPGGVEAYVVDLRGERYVQARPFPREEVSEGADGRHEATPEMWTETYLSAILRAIRYADDASYRLAGYRKLDPITTIEAESRFLKAAEELFFQGTFLYLSGIDICLCQHEKNETRERRGRRARGLIPRLATRFRPRNTGRYERHKSPHCCYAQILFRFIPTWSSCESIRKDGGERTGSRCIASEELYWNE